MVTSRQVDIPTAIDPWMVLQLNTLYTPGQKMEKYALIKAMVCTSTKEEYNQAPHWLMHPEKQMIDVTDLVTV